MNTFKDNAIELYESGLSIMPVKGQRAFLADWPKYCSKMPTEQEIESWCDKYPDYNIGLLIGPASGVSAVDVDTNDSEAIELIETIIPKSIVSKFGSKGYCGFHKNIPGRKTVLSYNGEDVVEVFQSWGMVVIPPSMHPKIHASYQWQNGIYLHEKLDDLPDLSIDQIHELESLLKSKSTVHKPKDKKNGRNNYLKSYIARHFDSCSRDELINKVIVEDKKIHGVNSLFTDEKEFASGSVDKNAFDFVVNICDSIARQKIDRRSTIDYESYLQNEYPSYSNGFFIPGEGKKKPTPCYLEMAKYVVNEIGAKVENGYLYIYNGTHYDVMDDDLINYKITLWTKERAGPGYWKQFEKQIRAQSICKPLIPSSGFINLKNGILNTKTGELIPHSKNYFFKYCLPHEFVPSATCNNLISWLSNKILDPDDIPTLFEFIGYILEGGYNDLNKALFIIGDSGSGKSQLLALISYLVGEDNCSAISIDQFKDTHTLAAVVGKLCNIVEEKPRRSASAEIFKAWIGNGAISINPKNMKVFRTRLGAKILGSLNDHINFDSSESTDALTRRLLYIRWRGVISNENSRGDYWIRFKSEIPGLINEAVAGLIRLRERGYFKLSKSMGDENKEFVLSQDNVCEFLQDYTTYHESAVPLDARHLYDIYRAKTKYYVKYKEFRTRVAKYYPMSLTNHGNKYFIKNVKTTP